ncbi:MAG: TraR/DksA C4-type zinc finger protein [Minisyncoccia bacterium]
MINTIHFKNKLEEELKLVEAELNTVARKNPSNPNDWEAIPDDTEIDNPDPNDAADVIEGFENNSGIAKELEISFNEIKNALKSIEDGTYGKCSVCGEEIPEKRLEVNPSASTCIKHAK